MVLEVWRVYLHLRRSVMFGGPVQPNYCNLLTAQEGMATIFFRICVDNVVIEDMFFMRRLLIKLVIRANQGGTNRCIDSI